MSDCRFGVSPVNYPDPDPDPASCQSMAHKAIYVNLHTRIRGVRPSTCFGLV